MALQTRQIVLFTLVTIGCVSGVVWVLKNQSNKTKPNQREVEPDLIVAPDKRVIVAWMNAETRMEKGRDGELEPNDGAQQLGVKISNDQGKSWVETIVGDNQQGLVADPWLGLDEKGGALLVWLDFRMKPGANAPFEMSVKGAWSAQGQKSFDQPFAIAPVSAQRRFDRPSVISTGKSPVVITKFFDSNKSGIESYSINATQVSQPTVIFQSADIDAGLPSGCSDMNGNMAVVWIAKDQTWISTKSPDTAWSPATATAPRTDNLAWEGPTCVREGNHIWVSYGVAQRVKGAGPLAKAIIVAHSGDAGATFSDITRLETGELMAHPKLVLERPDKPRLIYIVGKEHNDKTSRVEMRLWSKTEQAQLGSPEIVHAPVSLVTQRNDPLWTGDYAGAQWADGLWAAVVDNAQSPPRVRVVHK